LAYGILYWVHPAVSHLVLKLPLTARRISAAVLAAVLLADTVTTIHKLALTTRLMRRLEQARVQLALGRAELEDMLQDAKDDLSEKLASGSRERKARRVENNARLQRAYDELLAKAERTSRRFLRRYARMSSSRYSSNLSDLRRHAGQLRQRLKQAKQERSVGKDS
jgi:uncharacterized protein with von Willebrand factor type A (vWA) domain